MTFFGTADLSRNANNIVYILCVCVCFIFYFVLFFSSNRLESGFVSSSCTLIRVGLDHQQLQKGFSVLAHCEIFTAHCK